MPSWLGGWLVKAILDWVLGKLLALVSAGKKQIKDHKQNQDQAAQDAKKANELKPDATEKEIDDAIDDQLNRF